MDTSIPRMFSPSRPRPRRRSSTGRERGALLASALLLAACSRSSEEAKPPAETPPVADQDQTQTGAAAAGDAAACAKAKREGPLRWFRDDYAAALACARAQGKPLFIDDWAPWCHTCLSMKHTVFIDPALAPYAERFVWLAVDTDKPDNAEVVGKFPPQVWPTFFVIAPADESIQARYLGAASLAQFREFLDEGERAYRESQGDALPADSPLGKLRDGDRAVVAGDWSAAATAYADAVASARVDWPRRPAALVSLISAYYKAGDSERCAALAEVEHAATGNSVSAADFAYYAARCAERLAEQGADAARVRALREQLLAHLGQVADDAGAPLATDDRSEALRVMRELALALGDKTRADALAERQRALLDQAWQSAETPLEAMTFAWPAAEVYDYLGAGAELVPKLEKLEAELPSQYDPPYRLAWVQHRLGQHEQALAAAERARDKLYGPRKANALRLIADIHAARGEREAVVAARQAVVELYESLPEGQARPSALEDARAALEQAQAAE